MLQTCKELHVEKAWRTILELNYEQAFLKFQVELKT